MTVLVGVWDISCDGAVVLLPGGVGFQGCGAQVAAGALHAAEALSPAMGLEERARLACEAAIRFDSGCGGPVDVLSIGGSP